MQRTAITRQQLCVWLKERFCSDKKKGVFRKKGGCVECRKGAERRKVAA